MFRREENRVIMSKPYSYMAFKFQGEYNPITVNRAVYLKNNYCIYNDDSILYICENKEDKDEILNLFNKINLQSQYNSLFSLNDIRFHLITMKELIYNNSNLNQSLTGEEVNEIINRLKNELSLDVIKCEIDFIKANRLSKDDYMEISRRGTGIRKNSKKRREVYNIYLEYENILKANGTADYLDLCASAKKNIKRKYTHVFLENPHKLLGLEIDIAKAMVKEGTYSTFTGIFPVDRRIRPKKVLDVTSVHTFNIKNKVEVKVEKPKDTYKFIDYFKFIDLKHGREFNFKKDASQYKEIILMSDKDEVVCKENELFDLNVYSDIAAGEPILMGEDFDQVFSLPSYWIKGTKDCFMLKVKGDSMVGADINDGDFVVIRKQSMANNGDIVAAEIEGSATLKRLSISKKGAYLVPENDKYEPINMREREAGIIGIALGIIKEN